MSAYEKYTESVMELSDEDVVKALEFMLEFKAKREKKGDLNECDKRVMERY